MTAPRLIITGSGRCGTKYMSYVLRAAGIMCGHENVFHPSNREGIWPESCEWEADSSWLAMPFACNYCCPIVHLVRTPLECIRSLASCLLSQPADRYAMFMRDRCPEAFEHRDAFTAAANFYLIWNRSIEYYEGTHVAYLRTPIENPDHAAIFTLAGLDICKSDARALAAGVSKTMNSRSKFFQERNMESVRDHKLRDDLNKMSERYGYATYR